LFHENSICPVKRINFLKIHDKIRAHLARENLEGILIEVKKLCTTKFANNFSDKPFIQSPRFPWNTQAFLIFHQFYSVAEIELPPQWKEI